MVKIKRVLSDSYTVEFDNEIMFNKVKTYLMNCECGFDHSNETSATFHSNKVLKAIIAYCLKDGINFNVEF